MFQSEGDNPRVHAEWDGERLKRSDAVKCLWFRLQNKTGINDGRGFYTLRKTGATWIERINPGVTAMYLAHSEKGMRKHYAERDGDALAAATDELAQRLNLTSSI